MGISENALFPTNVSRTGRGIYFISRALLDAHNLSHALDIVHDFGTDESICAFGGSLNIGYMDRESGAASIVNVEISSYEVSVRFYNETKSDPNAPFHFNEYLRLQVPQLSDPSSTARKNRIEQLI